MITDLNLIDVAITSMAMLANTILHFNILWYI